MSAAEFDLFGQVPRAEELGPRGKHYVRPAGYAATPGTGPAGETCRTCKHLVGAASYSGKKRWLKCGLARERWTHGRRTDVLARSAACMRWEPEPER